jgi:WD repeat-containing protein 61
LTEKLSFVKEYHIHQAAVYALEQGPTSETFFSAGSDRKVILWNIETDEHKVVAQIPAMIVSLCYLPKQNYLLVGQTGGGIHVLDLSEKKEIKLLSAHKAYIFDIKYNKDTNQFYVASGDGSISIWNAENFELLHQVKLTEEKIRQLTFSTERNELAAGCGDGNVVLLNLSDYKIKQTLENESGVNSLLYINFNQHLLVGLKEAHLVEWDLMMYQKVNKFPAHNWAVYSLMQQQNSPYIISASRDKTIKVWDAATLKPLQRIQRPTSNGHTHSVNALLPLAESNYVISTGDDRRVKVWQLNN